MVSSRKLHSSIGLCLLLVVAGCSASNEELPHEHAVPAHTPRNMADLSEKIRFRLDRLAVDANDQEAATELADLIGWTAEISADTEIGEERWNPIFEVSESLRLAIIDDPNDWGSERRAEAMRLCQLVEDAWGSLAPDDQVDRYIGHRSMVTITEIMVTGMMTVTITRIPTMMMTLTNEFRERVSPND